MKKVAFLLVVALMALVAMPGGSALAQSDTMTISLMEENGSGQYGAAALVAVDGDTTAVAVNITGGSSVAQPAHIHRGQCGPTLDPKPAYPLKSLTDGKSETIVEVGLSELMSGNYAINIHKSGPEASVYVSCGNLAMMTTGGGAGTIGMPRTGNSGELLVWGALALLAVSITGTGFKLSRRRI